VSLRVAVRDIHLGSIGVIAKVMSAITIQRFGTFFKFFCALKQAEAVQGGGVLADSWQQGGLSFCFFD
jgi:hypothetical protein